MILTRISQFIAPFLPTIPVTTGELHAYVASTLTTVRWLLFALIATLFVMTVALVRSSSKPPLVIRVDQLGQAEAIKNYAAVSETQDVEVIAFSKEFLRSIVDVNSGSISKDLARALNMMTKQFQGAHIKKLQEGDYVGKIRKANIQRQLQIERLAITGKNDVGYELDVRGILSTRPLTDAEAPADRGGLLGQLYIVKVPRSELSPHGLLVSNFRYREVPLEEIYKKDEVETLKDKQ